MHHLRHTLPNGLTIVGEQEPSAHSLAMGFFVKTGSRDETGEISGVSHFLEHMMFKGTARRSPEEVNRAFDSMGARYNAFTSEEETVYYGAVLPRFQEGILDLLADMMRPALRDEDFEMEKNVIIEEISMYEDRPQFSTFDLLRSTYFAGHPLSHSVLGTKDSIRNLSREQMHAYFERRYAANNLTLAVTGHFDWEELVSQAEALCGGWNTAEAPRELWDPEPQPQVVVRESDKFNRQHVALMAPGYSNRHPERFAAAVGAAIIGGGEGTRLHWALVHPGIAESASLGHDPSEGTGVFYGYLLSGPERAQEALDIFRGEVLKACRDGVSLEEVERAKRRIASAMVMGAETPMGRLRSVGMDWMYRQEQTSPQDALERLLAVTPEAVNAVLAEKPFQSATVVGLGPVVTLH